MKSTDYNTLKRPTWCPGCGDFVIWGGIKDSLAQLGIPPHEAVIVYGIGCSGNMNNFIKAYAIHAIHGRTIPVATGVRLANNKLKVIAVSGDGDGYGIGMSHFIHGCRRNFDITYIVCDNQIYGLTTGQYSPTSQKGTVSKTSPQGAIDSPVNPITLALSSGATYVARGFSGDPVHLTKLIKKGLEHKGFSFIDVFQPCVTFNKVNTYDFFRSRVYELEKGDYTADSIDKAYIKSTEWDERIPVGLFYQRQAPTYEDELAAIQEQPLVKQVPASGHIDISESLKKFQ